LAPPTEGTISPLRSSGFDRDFLNGRPFSNGARDPSVFVLPEPRDLFDVEAAPFARRRQRSPGTGSGILKGDHTEAAFCTLTKNVRAEGAAAVIIGARQRATLDDGLADKLIFHGGDRAAGDRYCVPITSATMSGSPSRMHVRSR